MTCNQSHLDIDACLETLKKGECISELALQLVCRKVSELLLEESNVQPVTSPVTIVGDLHGQVFDLLQLLNVGGWPPESRYIFMGDFVDRGHHSVETLSLLLCLKVKYPAHVTLLRGNHESRQITQVYGFYDECLRKFGNASVWRHAVTCFDSLGLAALVDSNVLCVHGGLSPDVRTLDQVRAIDRHQEIPHQGAFCDLVWSDPEEIPDAWQVSPRGAGYLFGARVVDEFHSVNQLQLLARAHQLVMQGRQYHFDEQLVTVWSAPNYCYRCGNVAAMLRIGGSGPVVEENDEEDQQENTQGEEIGPKIAHGCVQQSARMVRGIRQHFTFFRETAESMHGPQGESRSQLVPYFL